MQLYYEFTAKYLHCNFAAVDRLLSKVQNQDNAWCFSNIKKIAFQSKWFNFFNIFLFFDLIVLHEKSLEKPYLMQHRIVKSRTLCPGSILNINLQNHRHKLVTFMLKHYVDDFVT